MALLTKDQILGATDRKFEPVQVPEWGGEVRVGTMSGLQRDQFDLAMYERQQARKAAAEKGEAPPEESVSYRALVVACSLVDEEGRPLSFTPEQLEALSLHSGDALDRVFDVANRLNVLTPGAKEKVKGES